MKTAREVAHWFCRSLDGTWCHMGVEHGSYCDALTEEIARHDQETLAASQETVARLTKFLRATMARFVEISKYDNVCPASIGWVELQRQEMEKMLRATPTPSPGGEAGPGIDGAEWIAAQQLASQRRIEAMAAAPKPAPIPTGPTICPACGSGKIGITDSAARNWLCGWCNHAWSLATPTGMEPGPMCAHCGKTGPSVAAFSKMPDGTWLHDCCRFGTISIERFVGKYVGCSFKTDYLPQRRHDFCSVKCFVATLDRVRAEDKARAAGKGGR